MASFVLGVIPPTPENEPENELEGETVWFDAVDGMERV